MRLVIAVSIEHSILYISMFMYSLLLQEMFILTILFSCFAAS